MAKSYQQKSLEDWMRTHPQRTKSTTSYQEKVKADYERTHPQQESKAKRQTYQEKAKSDWERTHSSGVRSSVGGGGGGKQKQPSVNKSKATSGSVSTGGAAWNQGGKVMTRKIDYGNSHKEGNSYGGEGGFDFSDLEESGRKKSGSRATIAAAFRKR